MLKLAVEKRDVFGKALMASRQAGQMPVVVYGNQKATIPYFVSQKDFKKVLDQAGESTVISLVPSGAGQASHDVLIHEVDVHPVTGEPRHADFYIIDKNKVIEIDVPLRYEGVSPAVKDLGGILVSVLRELKVETLPMNIPHDIEVDISHLATLESQILVKDLKLPAGVKVLNQPDAVVASISVAKEEVVEEAPVDLSAIEVEKKGKKEEEGAAVEGGEATTTKTEAKPEAKK